MRRNNLQIVISQKTLIIALVIIAILIIGAIAVSLNGTNRIDWIVFAE